MSDRFDVIIIGAGHNGLVSAAVLSGKGKRVLVLEANSQVGGLAASREFAPGYTVSSGAHILYGLHPKVYEQCHLSQAGLSFSNDDMDTIVTDGAGRHIRLAKGSSTPLTGNPAPDDRETQSWSDFHKEMEPFARILFDLSDKAPPRLKNGNLDDFKTLVKTGIQLRRLGQRDLQEFLRIIGMNIYDLVEEHFSSDLVKAAISWEAVLGTRLGPRAPNTVYNWLNRRSVADQNEKGLQTPSGGMGALSRALRLAAENKGAKVRTHCKVKSIVVSDNQVTGVELDNGETISADTIVSNADIRNTMLSLVGARHLETDFVRRVNWIPMQGSTAKLHLALNQLPKPITGNDSDFSSRMIFAPGTDAIERASNAIKYGEYPNEPVFELTVPSCNDPSLAPKDRHVMSVLVPYIPYQHKDGWDRERDALQRHLISHLERVFPGLNACVESAELLTPLDLEQQFNVTGGHWHHGEIGLERFLMTRPISGYSQYATPINGLFMCGADCHPGGDVTGTAGLNAAHALLKGMPS